MTDFTQEGIVIGIQKKIGLLISLALFGAGCKNSDDSCCSTSSKAAARQRAVATMRLNRASLAVAGIGRTITRAPHSGRKARFGVWLAAIRQHRAVLPPPSTTPALDVDTGLYYTITVNPDGSGQQNLFRDEAGTQTAGAFVWTAPQWNNGQTDNYPATFQTTYQITAGAFSGEHGTIANTANDATGDNGELTIDLTDAEGERCVSDFTIVNGVLSAKARCSYADYTTCDETFATNAADILVILSTFPDGGSETIDINPDDSATETVDGSGGQIECTGDVQPNGNDTIQYNDNSSETVNVDTNIDDSGDTNNAAKRGREIDRINRMRQDFLFTNYHKESRMDHENSSQNPKLHHPVNPANPVHPVLCMKRNFSAVSRIERHGNNTHDFGGRYSRRVSRRSRRGASYAAVR